MDEVVARPFKSENDIEILTQILKEAWDYYLQNPDESRLRELVEYYLTDDTKRFFIAFEGEKLVGVAEISIIESYRYAGEEGRLELLFIRDSSSNYYDVHTALMDGILDFLRTENIDYLRVDTTLENADVLFV